MTLSSLHSRGCSIAGSGFYAPEHRVSNEELEKRLNLEEGWIRRRTGIHARHYAASHEATSDLAVRAASQAIAHSGIKPEDIGLTLLATSTPDHLLPPTAPLVAHHLGVCSGALDLTGACSGFLYGLTLADAFVRAHGRPVLLIAANVLSRRINPKDRKTAVVFSDGAGALVLAPHHKPSSGIVGWDFVSDGAYYGCVSIPTGGSREPFSETTSWADTVITLHSGAVIFSKVVDMMVAASEQVLAKTGLSVKDITRWIPHQANGRILESARHRLHIPQDRMVTTVAEFGNTSAASLAFSLAFNLHEKPLNQGECLLLTAVGAGLSGGALVFCSA